MKKLLTAIVVVSTFLVVATGCDKDKIFSGIEVDIPAAEVNLPKIAFNPLFIPLNTPADIPIPIRQAFNLDDSIRKNTNGDFSAGDVKSVKIKAITIQLLNPTDSSKLSQFNSAQLFFSSNDKPSPELDLGTINLTGAYDFISYTPASAPEMREYLNGDTLIYRIRASLNDYPKNDMSLRIKATMVAK